LRIALSLDWECLRIAEVVTIIGITSILGRVVQPLRNLQEVETPALLMRSASPR